MAHGVCILSGGLSGSFLALKRQEGPALLPSRALGWSAKAPKALLFPNLNWRESLVSARAGCVVDLPVLSGFFPCLFQASSHYKHLFQSSSRGITFLWSTVTSGGHLNNFFICSKLKVLGLTVGSFQKHHGGNAGQTREIWSLAWSGMSGKQLEGIKEASGL